MWKCIRKNVSKDSVRIQSVMISQYGRFVPVEKVDFTRRVGGNAIVASSYNVIVSDLSGLMEMIPRQKYAKVQRGYLNRGKGHGFRAFQHLSPFINNSLTSSTYSQSFPASSPLNRIQLQINT